MSTISVLPDNTPRLQDQIPESLDHLIEILMQVMTHEDARGFYIRYLDALNTKADLIKVLYQFKYALLIDYLPHASDNVRPLVIAMAELQQRLMEGKLVRNDELETLQVQIRDLWQTEGMRELCAIIWANSHFPVGPARVMLAIAEATIDRTDRPAFYKRAGDKLVLLLEEGRPSTRGWV
jgi:hypothetical protein